jgi:hypothetical protein
MAIPRLRPLVRAGLAVCAAALIVACSSSPTAPPPPPPPPPPVNTPPQIKSVTVSDTRIEVGGPPVTVTAVVEDQETAPANLTYTWSAPTGAFTGAGAVVTWSPGTDANTPADYVLTLTVTERYASGSTTAENTATSTLTVHVNNSPKELADLSLRFLGDFADSRVSPDKCVSEFTDTCHGDKEDEFDDIFKDRHDFLHLKSTLRHTSLSISGDRRSATVHTFCSFTSRVITMNPISQGCLDNPGSCKFGGEGTAEGDCWTTGVYETGRWWLCASHYTPKGIATDFERAFFGIRR